MKHILKCICLWMIVLLPLTIYAELPWEVIFIHPDNPNELWITDLTDTDNARMLYQQKYLIRDFSVQKNGHYIATLTEYGDPTKPYDIYLIDTDNINQVERMMTHQRFNKILDVELSQNPELFFTNFLPVRTDKPKLDKFGRVTTGIYLIHNREIEDPFFPSHKPPELENFLPPREVLSPRVTPIKEVEAQHVALSPDKEYLAYDTPEGTYLIKFATGEVLRVSIGGSLPTFSPDGTTLAVVHGGAGLNLFSYDLDIFSVPGLRLLNTIEHVTNHINFLDMKWSPDGKYIVYTTYGGSFFEQNTSYHHYAIPYQGGEQIRILDILDNGVPMFDWWTSEAAYAVEPKNRLTTLWGKLKQ